MNLRGKKIFVGLSGGVDSAVSAALLKRSGADVTGVFIKGWYPPGMPCKWADERRDAMRVAARLRIQFRTLDAGAEYKKNVIDYMLSEYRTGRTPNPDVMCNRDIKFGVFYQYAMTCDADTIATGHYRSGEKDQSYFLWAVPKNILKAVLFPVGNMEKKEVRALAKRFNLPVADKKDSQGVCFLGAVSVGEFLEKELGCDNPALLYTIGQRVNSPELFGNMSEQTGPLYVVDKNVKEHKITVSRTRESAIRTIKFTDANWHGDYRDANIAQFRYRGARIIGHVDENIFVSNVLLPDIPVPGQSIVFYRRNNDAKGMIVKGDELVGGGIITK